MGDSPALLADDVKHDMATALSAGCGTVHTRLVDGARCWLAWCTSATDSDRTIGRHARRAVVADGEPRYACKESLSVDVDLMSDVAEKLVRGGADDVARLMLEMLGDFAVAVYDGERRRLLLARDRLGFKPLYWWMDERVVVFGTAYAALLRYPAIRHSGIDMVAVRQFLGMGYVPRPRTLIRGLQKVPQGTVLDVDLTVAQRVSTTRYWDVSTERATPVPSSEAADRLDRLLRQALEPLDSRKPHEVGAQLSGGVDSSLLVALLSARRGSQKPLRTYAVGFDVLRVDETKYAKVIAAQYRTDHKEIRITGQTYAAAYPRVVQLYGEPIGDPSAVATYLMGKVAAAEVSVMVGGEGADELFGGYRKYSLERYSRWLQAMPDRQREHLLRYLAALPGVASRWQRVLHTLSIPAAEQRFALWYGGFNQHGLHRLLGCNGDSDADWAVLREMLSACASAPPLSRQLYVDVHTRLAEYVLTNCERTSSMTGLAAHLPFLGLPVVQFAFALPSNLKIRGMQTKWVVKKLAERYLPHDVIYRPKIGFSIPLAHWFRGPLRSLVENTLLDERAMSRGIWRPDAIRALLSEHMGGGADRSAEIWAVFALESWLQVHIDGDRRDFASQPVIQRSGRTLPMVGTL